MLAGDFDPQDVKVVTKDREALFNFVIDGIIPNGGRSFGLRSRLYITQKDKQKRDYIEIKYKGCYTKDGLWKEYTEHVPEVYYFLNMEIPKTCVGEPLKHIGATNMDKAHVFDIYGSWMYSGVSLLQNRVLEPLKKRFELDGKVERGERMGFSLSKKDYDVLGGTSGSLFINPDFWRPKTLFYDYLELMYCVDWNKGLEQYIALEDISDI